MSIDSLRHRAKVLRAVPALNLPATALARSLMNLTGRKAEWVIRHLPRVGRASARLPNGRVLRLWSRGDEWISNQVFWRGWAGHEPETTRVFFSLAQASAATIDVGAYVGYYTLLAAHANPTGRVIALEPLPTIHARLTRHVALNGLSNVETLMAAAAAHAGSAEFHHAPHELPTSSSLSREFMSGTDGLVSSTVPVVSLDDLVGERRLGRVDLVKIDTESTEPDVLGGMLGVLARDRPNVVCEVLKGRGAEERLGPILEPFGYRFFLLTADGPRAMPCIEGHPTWLNYLFAAREGVVPLPRLPASAR
jgi:FkbM family methyltransferase